MLLLFIITICSSSWVFLMLLRCFPISQLLLHPFPFCPRASSFRRIRPHHGRSFRSCARTSSACHPTSVFHFSQFLLSFCLMSSSYCFHHSPYCFLYLSAYVDATIIVLIVSSYIRTVEQITINTPVCHRVTSEQESALSLNSSCDLHTSTIINSRTQLYTLHTSRILVTLHRHHTCTHLPTLCSMWNQLTGCSTVLTTLFPLVCWATILAVN